METFSKEFYTKYPIVIAVDPGVQGGMAIYERKSGQVYCEKMPNSMGDILDYWGKWEGLGAIVLLENIPLHAARMGGEDSMLGIKSIAKQAGDFRELELGLIKASIDYYKVAAQSWMKHFPERPRKKDERKKYLKQVAKRIFPQVKVTLWNSDALCMLSQHTKIIKVKK